MGRNQPELVSPASSPQHLGVRDPGAQPAGRTEAHRCRGLCAGSCGLDKESLQLGLTSGS